MAGFRTVVIQNPCKLTYKDGFLLIRGDELNTVHLSEIHTLVLDSTMTTVTGYLLCMLMQEKVNLIFCDEKRNPVGMAFPCYGSHDTAARVAEQAKWKEDEKALLWQSIIRQKITNQARVLESGFPEAAEMLTGFASAVTPGDETNREGHAAKVYFNRLFGKGFSRDLKCDINIALNYGYALLLSSFNKEITARGYATQLGVHHHNTYNAFNLSSDLMEPFRFVVDVEVLKHGDAPFDKQYKYDLLALLSRTVYYHQQTMHIDTAITRFVRNATEHLCGRLQWAEAMNFHYEDACYESDCDV